MMPQVNPATLASNLLGFDRTVLGVRDRSLLKSEPVRGQY